jgi:hypothetical protein
MSVDVDDGRLSRDFAHQMRVPDFFKQGARSHTVGRFHLRGAAPPHKPEFFVPAINHCNKSVAMPPIHTRLELDPIGISSGRIARIPRIGNRWVKFWTLARRGNVCRTETL